MESSFHRFPELFAQLGLAHDAASIKSFIAEHAPLKGSVRLDVELCENEGRRDSASTGYRAPL